MLIIGLTILGFLAIAEEADGGAVRSRDLSGRWIIEMDTGEVFGIRIEMTTRRYGEIYSIYEQCGAVVGRTVTMAFEGSTTDCPLNMVGRANASGTAIKGTWKLRHTDTLERGTWTATPVGVLF